MKKKTNKGRLNRISLRYVNERKYTKKTEKVKS